MKNDEVLKPPPNGRLGFQLSSCDSRVQNASHTLSTSLLSQQNGRPSSGTGIKLPTTLFNCAKPFTRTGSQSVGKEPKAELSLQINSRDFQDRRSSRTSNSSSLSLKALPGFRRSGRGRSFPLLLRCTVPTGEKEGKDSGPLGRDPSPPPERYSNA